MRTKFAVGPQVRAILVSALITTLMLGTLWQTLNAQEIDPRPPDLTESSKVVNADQAAPGSLLLYTVVVDNQGADPALAVTMTDPLPNELTLITNSISLTGGGSYTYSQNVITWTGAVTNDFTVQLSFNAQLTDTLSDGDWITNTAYITGTGELITRSAGTQIYTDTSSVSFMPAVFKPFPFPPTPSFASVGNPNSDNEWTVSWQVNNDTYVDNYTLQESQSPDFSAPHTVNTPLTSHQFSHAISADNSYYYRVRANGPGGSGDWSETRMVVGNYRDDFRDASTGWDIRRQDTDDIENYSRYRDGNFILEIDGRWDYAIGSPVALAPETPYAIETRVRLESADNLNAYGIVFGGDWNGEECSTDHMDNCFNHYYRLLAVWHGNAAGSMLVQLARIDRHDARENTGRGPDLVGWRDVDVAEPVDGYQVWRVEVEPNGRIRLFVNGEQFASVTDATYVDNPLFGVFAASDEYLGTEPWFDWYEVRALD